MGERPESVTAADLSSPEQPTQAAKPREPKTELERKVLDRFLPEAHKQAQALVDNLNRNVLKEDAERKAELANKKTE